MSIKSNPSEYGRKIAKIEQLIQWMNEGDAESKVELQKRLPGELENLRTLYLIAYGVDDAEKALIEDLSGLKPSVNYKKSPLSGAWLLEEK